MSLNFWAIFQYQRKMRSFILADAELYKPSFLNCFWFLVPPLLWNLLFRTKLPMGHFDDAASKCLLVAENIFRLSAMIYPFFFKINPQLEYFKMGVFLYGLGMAMYLASWAYLMFFPDASLSQSALMRFAPAYTPLIWFMGIALISGSQLFPILIIGFISLHVGEYLYRYKT